MHCYRKLTKKIDFHTIRHKLGIEYKDGRNFRFFLTLLLALRKKNIFFTMFVFKESIQKKKDWSQTCLKQMHR